jgi:hypothetical protein
VASVRNRLTTVFDELFDDDAMNGRCKPDVTAVGVDN